jgi:hypothetical protein
MTVRTWITVSVAVLVALSVAVLLQFTRPIQPPSIVVHAGDQHIAGALDSACWPQRSGKLRCVKHKKVDAAANTIPGNGSLRIVFAYPAEPKDGLIHISDDSTGRTVLRSGWKRTIRYDLPPGTYTMTARAGKSGKGAYVRYVFVLKVTRSGS